MDWSAIFIVKFHEFMSKNKKGDSIHKFVKCAILIPNSIHVNVKCGGRALNFRYARIFSLDSSSFLNLTNLSPVH